MEYIIFIALKTSAALKIMSELMESPKSDPYDVRDSRKEYLIYLVSPICVHADSFAS